MSRRAATIVFWTTIAILLCTILVCAILWIVILLRIPVCGSVDPNMQYCSNRGKLIRTETPSGSPPCDTQIDPILYTEYLTIFLRYITTLTKYRNRLVEALHAAQVDSNIIIIPGYFFFAIPELLHILPTDFGQNALTPYGFISFYNSYFPCISNPNNFCAGIFRSLTLASSPSSLDPQSTASLLENKCIQYVNYLSKTGTCPFPITDTDPNVYIGDPNFFNYIGLLGSFSLEEQDVVILRVVLPVTQLNLNYWSFIVYLADRTNPTQRCYPYRQVYAASIDPPLNMYTAVGLASHAFDPLQPVEGTTVVKDCVTFYIVMGANQTLCNDWRTTLSNTSKYPPADVIHICGLPTASKSMTIDPTLPNPNHLTTEESLVNLKTDRFACFLRLSPHPSATIEQKALLKDFIYRRDPFTDSFDVCLVRSPSTSIPMKRFSLPIYPSRIPPPVNEVLQYSTPFKAITHHIRQSLSTWDYHISTLQTRPSLTNIVAPLYRNIVSSKTVQYRGGYQAIQMAGNMQADNYDANYSLSQVFCLTDQDFVISISINHSAIKNAVYNSINVVDVNKGYGYDGLALEQTDEIVYHVVLIGRTIEILSQVQALFTATLPEIVNPAMIRIDKILVETGSAIQGKVPTCHQLLVIERVYLNTLYASLEMPDQSYSLMDLDITDTDDRWKSLVNVTAADPTSMIKPVFLYGTFTPNQKQMVLLITMSVCGITLLCVAVFGIVRWIQGRRSREHR